MKKLLTIFSFNVLISCALAQVNITNYSLISNLGDTQTLFVIDAAGKTNHQVVQTNLHVGSAKLAGLATNAQTVSASNFLDQVNTWSPTGSVASASTAATASVAANAMNLVGFSITYTTNYIYDDQTKIIGSGCDVMTVYNVTFYTNTVIGAYTNNNGYVVGYDNDSGYFIAGTAPFGSLSLDSCDWFNGSLINSIFNQGF